jgi:hypothetical protein
MRKFWNKQLLIYIAAGGMVASSLFNFLKDNDYDWRTEPPGQYATIGMRRTRVLPLFYYIFLRRHLFEVTGSIGQLVLTRSLREKHALVFKPFINQKPAIR